MLLGFRTFPILPSKLVQNQLKNNSDNFQLLEIEVTSLLENSLLMQQKCRGFSVFIYLNYILDLCQSPPQQDKHRPAFPSVSSLYLTVTVEGAGLPLASPYERGSEGLDPSGQFLIPGSPVRSHTPPSWEGVRQGTETARSVLEGRSQCSFVSINTNQFKDSQRQFS